MPTLRKEARRKTLQMANSTGNDKISVVIRVRPLSREEAVVRSPWKLSSKSIASNKTSRAAVPCHSFTFDRVYGTKATSLEIYDGSVKDTIRSAVSGYNATVISFGQPGGGKTHTMRRSPQEAGILKLAVRDVFTRINEIVDREYLLRVLYMEIDDEEIRDLLAPENHDLSIHKDQKGNHYVAGLREEITDKPEQVISLVEFADALRYSANGDRRSHTIFSMVIESRCRSQETNSVSTPGNSVRISILNLVDLTAPKSSAAPADACLLQTHQIAIKSLTALQTLVDKLSEGVDNQENKDELYMESKLTCILQPSFGGNSRTCFICNISPALVCTPFLSQFNHTLGIHAAN